MSADLCPGCQSPLPPNAAEGLCPKCLWASLLHTSGEPDEEGEKAAGIIGDYEILEEIARGGMGIVYRARQLGLGRVVALKMISSQRLPGEAAMRRFRAEAEAIASLDHPNIVPIYEIGEDNGQPFYTMKFAAGGSLAGSGERFGTARRGQSRFSEKEIAQLLAKTARAVHFAHRRGILHRDLKPSNILLDANGEPLVSDFGLAKQIEAECGVTLTGQSLGTPAYSPPEQAVGEKQLEPAADVYSLGSILFDLLTGRAPFVAPTPLETLRQVIETDPPKPRALCRSINPDLETICLRCLEKRPADRYSSAEGLADDLERWLRGEPILARPSTAFERTMKWARRRPAVAALVLLTFLAPTLIAGILLKTNSQIRRTELETRWNLYAADLFLADSALHEGNFGLARQTLQRHVPAAGQSDLRGFEWRMFWERSQGGQARVLSGMPRPPSAVAVGPDGGTLAIGGLDYLWRWNLSESNGVELLPAKEDRWLDGDKARALLARVRMTPLLPNQVHQTKPSPENLSQWVNPEYADDVSKLAFAPDGKSVITASRSTGRAVRIWNIADGSVKFAFPAQFSCAAMSPVARIAAVGSCAHGGTGGAGCVKVYDLDRREEILTIPHDGGLVGFSGDGETLATAWWDADALIERTALWSIGGRRLIKRLATKSPWDLMAISPDARFIAGVRAGEPTVEIWSTERENLVAQFRADAASIRALEFSPQGETLATGGFDQSVRLWTFAGELRATLSGHTDEISSIAFFPDGTRLASASRDGTVRIWPAHPNGDEPLARRANGFYGRFHFLGGGEFWMNDGGSNQSLEIFGLVQGAKSRLIPSVFTNQIMQVEGFDRGADSIVVSVYSPNRTEVALEWRSPLDFALKRRVELKEVPENEHISVRDLNAEAGLYARGEAHGTVKIWSTRDGRLLGAFGLPDHLDGNPTVDQPVSFVTLSPDGELMAATTFDHSQIAVFSISQNKLLHSQHARALYKGRENLRDQGELAFLAFSPDSAKLASVDRTEGVVRLWDAHTGKGLGVLAGHRDHTVSCAFSPDGNTLATSGADGAVKLWNIPTLRQTANLLASGAKGPLAFAPDGSALLVSLGGEVRAFRAPLELAH